MINEKLITNKEDTGDALKDNAVPLPNVGSLILQNAAHSGSLDASAGINLQAQQLSPWLNRQQPLISKGNASTNPGGSLLVGIPLSDLKKDQRMDWSDGGRGSRAKNKRRRKNSRENRKNRKRNRGNRGDFGRESIFDRNDRQRVSLIKEVRGNKKRSRKSDWAAALGSYPVVSSGNSTQIF